MDSANEFAKKQGFDAVDEVGEWKGFKVYEAYFDEENESSAIGLPQYILKKGDDLRFCEPEETFDIMDSIDIE